MTSRARSTTLPAEVIQFPLLFDGHEEASVPAGRPAEDLAELPDHRARLAALDIHRSWIVEAPAGSGKTGLLIQRLLKLLARGGVTRPDEVLAITFTRKAAQELRNRVLEQLLQAAEATPLNENAAEFERTTRVLAEAVLERDRALGWHLVQMPQQLNVRTIDSFCGELARNMPLLSGGMGQRSPVDDASGLYNEAAGRVLRQLGTSDTGLDTALRRLLLHRDGRVQDVIELISGMLAEREQWGELIPLAASELTEERLDQVLRQHLDQTLEALVSQGLSRAAQSLPAGWLGEAAALAAGLSGQPGHGGQPSPLLPFSGRPAAPGTAATEYNQWLALTNLMLTEKGLPRSGLNNNHLGFELPKEAKPELKDLIEHLKRADELEPGTVKAFCAIRDLPPASMPDDQWDILKAVFHVLRRALAELEVLFDEEGVCDFPALALTARRLLEAEASGTDEGQNPVWKLQHLLVDEMQDTSVGQYRLFELLTRSWDGGSQTAFLVGDPKQSIYAFRQARVERFLRTQRTGRLGTLPLGSLHLTANFRSQAELVQDFNATFVAILPHPEQLSNVSQGAFQAVDVPFTEAIPLRPPGAAPALHWHPRLLAPPTSSSSSLPRAEEAEAGTPAEQDARSIRRTIEAFLARWRTEHATSDTARPPKVAVLARNRAHLAPIVAELQRGETSVPFRAVQVELLNQRPEVLDLIALTRALLHPGDRVAWLAILRSPVCGLSLADLLTLTGEGREAETTATLGHLVETRRHRLSAQGQVLLQRVWPVLAHAQGTLGQTSLSTHVERTWRSLGADAPLHPDGLANAKRYLLLLHQLEAGTEPLSLHLLDRAVRKLYAESSSTSAFVELMTIHKSKGLEWDLVLIPSMGRGSGRGDQEMLRWFELDRTADEPSPIVLAPLSAKGEEGSRLWRWLGCLKTERELAESKRLFYVACTRAREELHLYGAVELTKSGALGSPRPGSLLHASWPAARPHFERQLAGLGKLPAEAIASTSEPVVRPAPTLPASPGTYSHPLALAAAAAAESEAEDEGAPEPERRAAAPTVQRLSASFEPLARFLPQAGAQLPYPPASTLRHEARLVRPEGSFAARAFGNVMHRFLDLVTRQRAAGESTESLLAGVARWPPRFLQAFRAEGLTPALCEREAARVLRALEATLLDPVGSWLLAPHQGAWSERTLQVDFGSAAPPANLRADRLFLGGATPQIAGSTHLWIVDFKSTEQGGRPDDAFFAAERQKYTLQMQGYAKACITFGEGSRPIMLALFYPLLTHLVYWPFEQEDASEIQAVAVL